MVTRARPGATGAAQPWLGSISAWWLSATVVPTGKQLPASCRTGHTRFGQVHFSYAPALTLLLCLGCAGRGDTHRPHSMAEESVVTDSPVAEEPDTVPQVSLVMAAEPEPVPEPAAELEREAAAEPEPEAAEPDVAALLPHRRRRASEEGDGDGEFHDAAEDEPVEEQEQGAAAEPEAADLVEGEATPIGSEDGAAGAMPVQSGHPAAHQAGYGARAHLSNLERDCDLAMLHTVLHCCCTVDTAVPAWADDAEAAGEEAAEEKPEAEAPRPKPRQPFDVSMGFLFCMFV